VVKLRPLLLYLVEGNSTYFTGGWASHRAVRDGLEKMEGISVCYVKRYLWFVVSVLYVGTDVNGSFVVSDT
jgi:hypothetical protein